eukprot:8533090-Karenia_brevis.AAC.1
MKPIRRSMLLARSSRILQKQGLRHKHPHQEPQQDLRGSRTSSSQDGKRSKSRYSLRRSGSSKPRSSILRTFETRISTASGVEHVKLGSSCRKSGILTWCGKSYMRGRIKASNQRP